MARHSPPNEDLSANSNCLALPITILLAPLLAQHLPAYALRLPEAATSVQSYDSSADTSWTNGPTRMTIRARPPHHQQGLERPNLVSPSPKYGYL